MKFLESDDFVFFCDNAPYNDWFYRIGICWNPLTGVWDDLLLNRETAYIRPEPEVD